MARARQPSSTWSPAISSPTPVRSCSTEWTSEGARRDMLRGSASPARSRFRNCSLSSPRPKIWPWRSPPCVHGHCLFILRRTRRDAATRRSNCWRGLGLPISPTARSLSSPAACASWSTSPWRWSAGRTDIRRFSGREIRYDGSRDPCRCARCRNHCLRRTRHGDRQPLCRPGGGVLSGPHPRRWRTARSPDGSGSAPLRHRGRAMSAVAPMLEIDHLVVEIQSMPALRGFSMHVARGAIASLVGRNGAGKTTLMRSIMGHLKPAQGAIRFEGADLSARPRHARAALGIGYMPEDRGLVPQLTVEENILLPLWVAEHLDRKARLDFVYEVIGELTEMRHRKALLLSGGQQKLVALGRALGIGTKCLLLDEPFEGIAPALSERLSEVLASLKGKDLTLLMSQSDMNHSRGLIDVEFTIERGANLASE